MKIMVVSGMLEMISEYLKNAGHSVIECLSTDHAAGMVDLHNPDVVMFSSNVVEMREVTLRDALRAIVPKVRVVLLADKTDPLVVYASGLGVRDYVFLPADPAAVLHRLETPALPEEAAELLAGKGITIPHEEVDLGPENMPDKKDMVKIGMGMIKSIRGAVSKHAFDDKGDTGEMENWDPGDEDPCDVLSVDDAGEISDDPEEGLTWKNEAPENWSIETPEAVTKPRQNQNKRETFLLRKKEPERDMCYMPHQLVAVWSPDGWAKSYTAVNLAAVAAAKGFDAALVNYDLLCPDLDKWFEVKQTGLSDFDKNSAGIMTFESFRPELMSRFLKKRNWGVQYLPAGNKIGNIGTPEIPLEVLEQTLKLIYQRNTRGKPAITIVGAGSGYEFPPTLAALSMAAIVLVPSNGSPSTGEIAQDQIGELNRLGYAPRFIELLFSTPGRKAFHVCDERYSIPFDWQAYLIDQDAKRPQCQRVEGRRIWEGVLNQLAPSPRRR